MNSQALSSWIQAIGAIAILGGLGLVVWELQQAREIAKAQQASDGSAGYSQRVQAMMGEKRGSGGGKGLRCTRFAHYRGYVRLRPFLH